MNAIRKTDEEPTPGRRRGNQLFPRPIGPNEEHRRSDAPPRRDPLLALQRTPGNRAVSQLVAARRQPIVQRKSPEDHPKDEPKTKPNDPTDRKGMEDQILILIDGMKDVRLARLSAWRANAEADATHIDTAVLETVIAMVALGFGGVVDHFIAEAFFEHDSYLRAFVTLTGLEGGDIAAEAVLKSGVSKLTAVMDEGTTAVRDNYSAGHAQTAFKTLANKPMDAFVEGIRLQIGSERIEESAAFNKDKAHFSDADIAGQYLTLKRALAKSQADPAPYAAELTSKYVSLLGLADKAGGSGAINPMGPGGLRLGRTGGTYTSIGSWSAPDLGSVQFWARANSINTWAGSTLLKTPLERLPGSLSIELWGNNPFHGWLASEVVNLGFDRLSDGTLRIHDTREDSMEWYASYSDHQDDEHTEAQREVLAPKGVAKLWNAIKDKTLTDVRGRDSYW